MKKIYLQGYIITIGLIVLFISSVFIYNRISKPGNYVRIGKHNGSKVYLRATPEYEYQVIMEADSIEIYSFGVKVATMSYDTDLGKVLLKDNE
jgi:hypothetical protein